MTERQLLNKIISEELTRLLTPRNRTALNENKTDRQVNNIIKEYSPTSSFDEIRQIRALFLNQIPNARSRNQKWICTVLRWWFMGKIPEKEKKKLDKFLGWLNDHDYPDPQVNNTDWSHLTFQDIRQAYQEMFPELKPKEGGDRRKVKHINGFTIRRIDSDEEAQQLGMTTYENEWCILYGMFDEMVEDCTCYIISNDKTYSTAKPMGGGEIVRKLREMGLGQLADTVQEYNDDVIGLTEDCDEYFEVAYGHDTRGGNDPLKIGLMPFDTYGLSAIAVLVGEDGELYGVYSRYNLPNMYDGQLLNKQQLSRLIQHDINDACPYVEKTQPQ